MNRSKESEKRYDNFQAGDERTELLETIREIVDQEVDRKLVTTAHDYHPENPSPRLKLLKRLFGMLKINMPM